MATGKEYYVMEICTCPPRGWQYSGEAGSAGQDPHLTTSSYFERLLFIYLKDRITERKTGREMREIFHLLVQFPSGYYGWGWARAKDKGLAFRP